MAKRNSRRPDSGESPAGGAIREAPETPDTPMLLDPPPPPTGRQKLALAIMTLVTLCWLAFLAALAIRK